MLFSLQNLAICSVGTTGQGMSHLFAKRTTGIFEPSGSVTFSLKSHSHFLIDWNVAIREISKTKAAATLKITCRNYQFINDNVFYCNTQFNLDRLRLLTRICNKLWSYIQIFHDRRHPWKKKKLIVMKDKDAYKNSAIKLHLINLIIL